MVAVDSQPVEVAASAPQTAVDVVPPTPVEAVVETPGPPGPEGPQAVPAFDYPGPLAPGTSDKLPAVSTIHLSRVLFALASAGTTDTEVGLLKNGVTATTATVPAGETLVPFTIPGGLTLLADTDVLQLEIVVAGAGAEGLTAVLA